MRAGADAGRRIPRADDDAGLRRLRGATPARARTLSAGSLRVTGSPRLDALIAHLPRCAADDPRRGRRAAGVGEQRRGGAVDDQGEEARHVLPALRGGRVASRTSRLVIKPHPGRNAGAYDDAAVGTAARTRRCRPPRRWRRCSRRAARWSP